MNYTGSYLNSGDTIIENKAGDTNLDGDLIQNTHKMVVKNSGEALNIDGTVTGQDANITVYNTGKAGMVVNGSIAATGKGDNISIINKMVIWYLETATFQWIKELSISQTAEMKCS